MTPSIQTRVASFLRREFAPSKGGGRIVRLECRQFPINAKHGEEIWALDVSESFGDSAAIEDLALEISKLCDDDAEGLASGPQRYALFLFRASKPERSAGRLVFIVDATNADEEGELETEPASRNGLVAQSMRHLEATQRMMIGSMAQIMAAQQKAAATLAAENEKLREERLEAMTAIEEVFSQRHERDLATEQARARTEILKDGAQKLTALAPMVIGHLTGKTSPELGAAARVQGLLADMSEDQKIMLIKLISSEEFNAKDTQKLALGDLLKSLNGNGEGAEH